MHLSEILQRELAALRERAGEDALRILETGTIRNTEERYRINDGWSTLTFAEEVRDYGGVLTAIDLDTLAAGEVIIDRGLREHVNFIDGHSIDVLAGMLLENANGLGRCDMFDVAFLDSDNDAGLILHEYLIVSRMMRSSGLIMVDDVDMSSTGVVKGHQIIPWLDREGIPWRAEIRHGDGYETGVLIIEV